MSTFPTAMKCLASELEATNEALESMWTENHLLREKIRTLEAENKAWLAHETDHFLKEIETEALVELANRLAPFMGMTKPTDFDERVRQCLATLNENRPPKD